MTDNRKEACLFSRTFVSMQIRFIGQGLIHMSSHSPLVDLQLQTRQYFTFCCPYADLKFLMWLYQRYNSGTDFNCQTVVSDPKRNLRSNNSNTGFSSPLSCCDLVDDMIYQACCKRNHGIDIWEEYSRGLSVSMQIIYP